MPFRGWKDRLDNEWIKTAAAQVRTTIRQAVNKVDRIGNGNAGRTPRQALDDAPGGRNHPEGKDPGADNK